jgi:hypothetical protein
VGDDNKARQCQKFAWLTKNQHPDTPLPKNTVINLSDHKLEDGTLSLLEKGLELCGGSTGHTHRSNSNGDRKSSTILTSGKNRKVTQESVRIIKTAMRNKDNLTKKERTALCL